MKELIQILIMIYLVGHPEVGTTISDTQISPTPTSVTIEVRGTSTNPVNLQVISLVNTKRQERGLKPVIYNSRIASGAYVRAKNIVLKNQFSHQGLAQALWNAGLRNWYSENLARGYGGDPMAIVNAWADSPIHAEKMFDERCTLAGVATYGDVMVLWMGVCGQPR